MKFPRRKFFKLTALGSAGIVAGTTLVSADDIRPSGQDFLYRTLGRTGIKLPVISSGKIPSDNDNLARAILKSGIVHIDTANRYDEGKNEIVLGRLLKEVDRSKFIIATKIEEPTDKLTGDFTDKASVESFLQKFDESLLRLDMGYVDILYQHAMSSVNAIKDTRFHEAMINLKKQGKVKFLGISTHANIEQSVYAAVDAGVYDVILLSLNFKQPDSEKILKALDKANEAGIGIIAMKTLAGKYLDKEQTQKVNSKAALKWVLQHPAVSSIIISIRSYEQLGEYLSVATDIRMNEQEIQDIQTYKNSAQSLFCPGCRVCIEQCPNKLPVPDLMRAYMYTYGYRNLTEGKQLVSELNLPDECCKNCENCMVICPSKFDVAQKIKDIIRIKNIPDEFLA